MQILKVDYKKHFAKDGTVYTQTITIDDELKEKYNLYLMGLKQNADKNYLKKKSYSEQDLKIKGLDYLLEKTNFCNLIHLDIFLQLINFLNSSNLINTKINFKRVLYRNTIIKVI